METVFQQLPVVVGALNEGFVQTLKLFSITLLGALPLGLIIAFGSLSRIKAISLTASFIIWIIRGTPLMIQLLIVYYFPGLVLHSPIWGGGEQGRFLAASAAFSLSVFSSSLSSTLAGWKVRIAKIARIVRTKRMMIKRITS